MRSTFVKLLFLTALAVPCLIFTGVRAQNLAQYSPPQGPNNYQDDREHRHEEHERQEQQELREEEWRKHNQRYFGGVVVQPAPNENPEAFRHRMHAQCNAQWNVCANRCNTMGNPFQRATCVATCNNELNECNQF